MMQYTGTPAEMACGEYSAVNAQDAAPRNLTLRRAAVAAAVLAMGTCLLGLSLYGATGAQPSHSLGAAVQLNSAEPEQDAQKTTAWFLKPRLVTKKAEVKMAHLLHKVAKAATNAAPTQASLTEEPTTKAQPSATEPDSELAPIEDLHDGNVCDLNEELYHGLCYKKCSLLTRGEEPIRSSPWSCCKEHPCGLKNEKASIGKALLCEGYDVSGSDGCPHEPGACLTDEEMHIGVCYKKCSLLTDGEFPNRVAAATCCKTKGLSCLNIFNDKTSKTFAVGGGKGDHNPSTPSHAHLPMESLTEEKDDTKKAKPAITASVPNSTAVAKGRCKVDEELYSGLCYKTCELLTSGQAKIRTSSWTCCKAHPCMLTNQMGSVGHTILCNGYDVASDGKCPRAPGTCPDDEEPHLGACYKKCSDLTHGEYPTRIAAATCCKGKGLSCLNIFHDKTSSQFDVGSGAHEDKPAYMFK